MNAHILLKMCYKIKRRHKLGIQQSFDAYCEPICSIKPVKNNNDDKQSFTNNGNTQTATTVTIIPNENYYSTNYCYYIKKIKSSAKDNIYETSQKYAYTNENIANFVIIIAILNFINNNNSNNNNNINKKNNNNTLNKLNINEYNDDKISTILYFSERPNFYWLLYYSNTCDYHHYFFYYYFCDYVDSSYKHQLLLISYLNRIIICSACDSLIRLESVNQILLLPIISNNNYRFAFR